MQVAASAATRDYLGAFLGAFSKAPFGFPLRINRLGIEFEFSPTPFPARALAQLACDEDVRDTISNEQRRLPGSPMNRHYRPCRQPTTDSGHWTPRSFGSYDEAKTSSDGWAKIPGERSGEPSRSAVVDGRPRLEAPMFTASS